ncbi:MAG: GNAT family N-acetyltransferase, partial [Bacteroidaceae bacterium]|nr:GNAT family N-acetyltransferase [Bacteroidaceae bacterium]
MYQIRKATIDDCALINVLAKEVFPVTYKEILSKEQMNYMMDWMYSLKNIRK